MLTSASAGKKDGPLRNTVLATSKYLLRIFLGQRFTDNESAGSERVATNPVKQLSQPIRHSAESPRGQLLEVLVEFQLKELLQTSRQCARNPKALHEPSALL
uniref:Uncharacterized protein n=1 Tax=Trichuris muris TaxID=70415 RepID=A0A5S6QCE1_TRIMR